MSRKRLVDAGMDNGDCCSVDEGLTLLTVVFFHFVCMSSVSRLFSLFLRLRLARKYSLEKVNNLGRAGSVNGVVFVT